jgi:hypothetical protein
VEFWAKITLLLFLMRLLKRQLRQQKSRAILEWRGFSSA